MAKDVLAFEAIAGITEPAEPPTVAYIEAGTPGPAGPPGTAGPGIVGVILAAGQTDADVPADTPDGALILRRTV